MQLRPLAGGAAILASLPMLGFVTSPPPPSHANVSIVLSAAESCVWYLENLPSSINMQSAEQYRGEAMSVSATISPAIGFSGNPEVPGYTTSCSFFNSSLTIKRLSISIEGNQFVARYSEIIDDSLSFGLDQRPLLVAVTSSEDLCPAVDGLPLDIHQSFGWGVNYSDVDSPVAIASYSNTTGVGEKNHFPSGSAARCAPELELKVEISSDQPGPPAGAGVTYIFSGPDMTFTLADN